MRLRTAAVTLPVLALALACDSSKPTEAKPGEDSKPQAAAAEGGGGAKGPADEAAGKPVTPEDPDEAPAQAPAVDFSPKVAQFATAEITADISALPPSEKKTLEKLIDAAKQLDPVFDRQAWSGNPDLEEELRKAKEAGDDGGKYAYFRIMRGPWDRQADFEPFATDKKRPDGGGYYPDDLTAEEFDKWIADNPGDKEAFESLTTVIERKDGKLVARAYSDVYAKWLVPASKLLLEASETTEDPTLQKFLKSRAKSFLSDDYYESDKDWMDLNSQVEITIGPYETYEDHLKNLKASFEAFITISDPKASEELAKYKKYLPEMEQHLPVPNDVKTERGRESPIRVVDLVYTAGDARKSVQTIAFNLPNDERVRAEKGAKKVLLRNLIRTKFDKIMKPIGEQVLAKDLHPLLSGDAFFNQVLFHELSHSLGPAYVKGAKGEEALEIRVALGPAYSALEECKADVMGVYNILFMIEKGELEKDFRDKVLASYFAGLFRSVRFGVNEAHGRGAAVQINWFLADSAATYDKASKTFTIDFDKLIASIEGLTKNLVMLQHEGDKAAVEKFLDKLGIMSSPMKDALTKLEGIPVDIRPVYPVAGESAPR